MCCGEPETETRSKSQIVPAKFSRRSFLKASTAFGLGVSLLGGESSLIETKAQGTGPPIPLIPAPTSRIKVEFHINCRDPICQNGPTQADLKALVNKACRSVADAVGGTELLKRVSDPDDLIDSPLMQTKGHEGALLTILTELLLKCQTGITLKCTDTREDQECTATEAFVPQLTSPPFLVQLGPINVCLNSFCALSPEEQLRTLLAEMTHYGGSSHDKQDVLNADNLRILIPILQDRFRQLLFWGENGIGEFRQSAPCEREGPIGSGYYFQYSGQVSHGFKSAVVGILDVFVDVHHAQGNDPIKGYLPGSLFAIKTNNDGEILGSMESGNCLNPTLKLEKNQWVGEGVWTIQSGTKTYKAAKGNGTFRMRAQTNSAAQNNILELEFTVKEFIF